MLAGCGGADGKPGRNGTDNHFTKSVICIGTLNGGAWNGVSLLYKAYLTSSGDVFVEGSLSGLGSFNVSETSFYSSSQSGADSGAVIISVDNYNFFTVSLVLVGDVYTVKAVDSSTNGNGATYINAGAYQVQSY